MERASEADYDMEQQSAEGDEDDDLARGDDEQEVMTAQK